jgi:hypothetical protein
MEQYSLLKQAVHIVTTVHESVKDIPRKIINCSILCSFFSVNVIIFVSAMNEYQWQSIV